MTSPKPISGIANFKAHKVTHHRNGICGRAFYTVEFSYDDENFDPPRRMPNMVAVKPVVERADSPGVECYVLNLNDASDARRGDNFMLFVAEAIQRHQDRNWSRVTTKQKAQP